jgi:hypothetical protein
MLLSKKRKKDKNDWHVIVLVPDFVVYAKRIWYVAPPEWYID